MKKRNSFNPRPPLLRGAIFRGYLGGQRPTRIFPMFQRALIRQANKKFAINACTYNLVAI